jgi:hypothetical protein
VTGGADRPDEATQPDPQADQPAAGASAEGVGGPPYRIDFEITVDGFVDASRLALTWMRTRILVLSAVAAIAGLLLVVFVPTAPGLMLVFFAVILVAFIATPVPERWLVRRRAGDAIGTPVTIRVTTEGLDVSTPTAGGQITWAGLTEVRDDGRAIVFMRQRVVASWAPASALGSAERRSEIVRFARGRIAATR